jgi:uncharacterized membrane protein
MANALMNIGILLIGIGIGIALAGAILVYYLRSEK